MMLMESQLQPLIFIPGKISCCQLHWTEKSKFGTPKKQHFNTLYMDTMVAPLQDAFPLMGTISQQAEPILWLCSGSQILAKIKYKKYNLSILTEEKPNSKIAATKMTLVSQGLNQKYKFRRFLDKKTNQPRLTLKKHRYLRKSKRLLT